MVVERLKLSLTQQQLNTLQLWSKAAKYVAAKMQLEQVLQRMRARRPPDDASPRQWWRYTTQCIVSLHQNVKRKHLGQGTGQTHQGRLDLSLITNFAANKQRYCELYQRKMRPNSLKNWLAELMPQRRREQMHKRRDFQSKQKHAAAEQLQQSDAYAINKMLWSSVDLAQRYVVREAE